MHKVVQGAELVAWDLLMGRMGVKDAWYALQKHRNSLILSRVGCNINGFCMSRIDRIYISAELEKYGSNVEIITGQLILIICRLRLRWSIRGGGKGIAT